MALVNENYLKLQGSYLFAEIAHRVQKFKAENPEAEVISLGIGDVTLPLPQVSIEAMHKAVDEMEIDVDDRILIKWEKDNSKKIAFPIGNNKSCFTSSINSIYFSMIFF